MRVHEEDARRRVGSLEQQPERVQQRSVRGRLICHIAAQAEVERPAELVDWPAKTVASTSHLCCIWEQREVRAHILGCQRAH